MNSHDDIFMRSALAMARRGLGRTWPNPAVGAVVVAPGGNQAELISRGWTMPGGRPHAETEALTRAGERARGATLYVTLEPCAHHGKTPPCVDAIVAAGIARVVCALDDPDPRVAGQGVSRLEDAGIRVDMGILRDEAYRLARGHILRVREQRPEVTLKIAVGSDGLMAPGDGAPVWVTGETARARGHLMRARSDAILVGRGTVEADDPTLTCRLPGMEERSPVRIVMDSRLALHADAKLLQTAGEVPLWLICREDVVTARREQLTDKGATVITVQKGDDGRPDPLAVCRALAEKGITRLLIEGGPGVARAFLDNGLVDRAVIFKGPSAVGERGIEALRGQSLDDLEKAEGFEMTEVRNLGEDQVTIFEKTR